MERLTAQLRDLVLPEEEKQDLIQSTKSTIEFLEQGDKLHSFSAAYESIRVASLPPHLQLSTISVLLDKHPDQWPTIDLVRAYNKLWRSLPENIKTKHDILGSILVETIHAQVKSSYRSFTDVLLPDSRRPALIDPFTWNHISHDHIRNYIADFRLPVEHEGARKPVVALAIPNGPHLGLACLAVTTYFKAAPLNTNGGRVQFRADVEQVAAKVVLALPSLVDVLGLDDPWYEEAGINILIAEPQHDFTLKISSPSRAGAVPASQTAKNGPDDVALILMTSGTSGSKKIVPMTLHSIISSVTMVIDSWGLTEGDCCLNMMPLNHVYVSLYPRCVRTNSVSVVV